MAAKPTPKKSPKMEKVPVVTGSMFYKHAACPHWLWFDLFGDPKKMQKRSVFAQMLLEMGVKNEKKIISGLEYVEVKGRGNASRFQKTLELMKDGTERIYHGLLMAGDMVGEPDILEKRTDRSSDLGAYYYEAIDIKSAEKLTDSHKYQLVFYSELLHAAQGVRPADGYIINASGARIGFNISEFEQQFHRMLGELRRTVAGEMSPPHVSSGCKQSPWFKQCIAYAQEKDDIALLYNVKKKTIVELREAGILTLDDAERMNVDALDGTLPHASRKTLDRIVYQARALRENRHFIRRPIELPTAPVEIFFDIEGDPLRQVEYLFGFLMRAKDGKEKYEYQLAKKPEDEGKMWDEFIGWLETLPDEYAVYHYGTYEAAKLTALESKYGGSKKLNKFRDKMVDLNELVKDAIVFPLYFYGIKDIGGYIGFERSKKISGGGESVAFYEDWLEKKDKKKLDDIIKYNEDDVVATRFLKDWLVEAEAERKNGK